jgi:antitoxin component of MazEF toxin-antitoxin module
MEAPMAVVKKLTRIGDSRALILPKPFLDQLALTDPNAEVEIALEQDRIIVTPHRYASDAEFRASAKRMSTKHRKSLDRLGK